MPRDLSAFCVYIYIYTGYLSGKGSVKGLSWDHGRVADLILAKQEI